MVSYFLNKYFSLGFKKVLNDYIYYPEDKRKQIQTALLLVIDFLPSPLGDKEIMQVRARSLLKNAMPFFISFILVSITNSIYVFFSCFLFSFVIVFFQAKYLQKEIEKIEKQINELKTKKRASNLYIKTINS